MSNVPYRSIERCYDNLSRWIYTVLDVDDRDDILDWAKRVQSGKHDTEWFDKRVKGLLS